MGAMNLWQDGGDAAPRPRPPMGIAGRVLRRALRPFLGRLIEVLNHLADRLDLAHGRLNAGEARLAEVEGNLRSTEARLDLAFEKIRHAETRHDQAEGRLDQAERNVEILYHRTDGTTAHLNGLTEEHHDLNRRFESRPMPNQDWRFEQLEEKLQAFEALHWDHVALTRRLAVVEDLLNGTADRPTEPAESEPSIPFPGFEGEARSRVG